MDKKRKLVHDLVDDVFEVDLDDLIDVLISFIDEKDTEVTEEELKDIRNGAEEINRGDYSTHDEVFKDLNKENGG
ncbi:hypothetical protein Q7A53_02040 [Halobacillus rhizosphaerae]|uniref:hypothetical protein n=1 Tax=Halobacillus rhizosphaerae TaxID=3064889 RepID=UPI00398A7D8F